jgi:hypothetical protein
METVRRLDEIPGFNIDRVAAAAGHDPDVLRMENLDTDVPPPAAALEATRAAVGEDEATVGCPSTAAKTSRRRWWSSCGAAAGPATTRAGRW